MTTCSGAGCAKGVECDSRILYATSTVNTCTYRALLPCSSDTDCGTGFTCQPTVARAARPRPPTPAAEPAPEPAPAAYQVARALPCHLRRWMRRSGLRVRPRPRTPGTVSRRPPPAPAMTTARRPLAASTLHLGHGWRGHPRAGTRRPRRQRHRPHPGAHPSHRVDGGTALPPSPGKTCQLPIRASEVDAERQRRASKRRCWHPPRKLGVALARACPGGRRRR